MKRYLPVFSVIVFGLFAMAFLRDEVSTGGARSVARQYLAAAAPLTQPVPTKQPQTSATKRLVAPKTSVKKVKFPSPVPDKALRAPLRRFSGSGNVFDVNKYDLRYMPKYADFSTFGDVQANNVVTVILKKNATVAEVNALLAEVQARVIGLGRFSHTLSLLLDKKATDAAMLHGILDRIARKSFVVAAFPVVRYKPSGLGSVPLAGSQKWHWSELFDNDVRPIRGLYDEAYQAWERSGANNYKKLTHSIPTEISGELCKNPNYSDVCAEDAKIQGEKVLVVDSWMTAGHPEFSGGFTVVGDQDPPEIPSDVEGFKRVFHGLSVVGTMMAPIANREGIDGFSLFKPLLFKQLATLDNAYFSIIDILARYPSVRVVNTSFGVNASAEMKANGWTEQEYREKLLDPQSRDLNEKIWELVADRKAKKLPSFYIITSASNYADEDTVLNNPLCDVAITYKNPQVICVENYDPEKDEVISSPGEVAAPGTNVISLFPSEKSIVAAFTSFLRKKGMSQGEAERRAKSALNDMNRFIKRDYNGKKLPQEYQVVTGTSYASPIVAGIINNLLHFSSYDVSWDIKDMIIRAARGYGKNRVRIINALTVLNEIDRRNDKPVQGKIFRYFSDINDGWDVATESKDGNERQDRAGTTVVGKYQGRVSRGDGIIDMRDFRVFRDAHVKALLPGEFARLNGGANHPKNDYNGDGCVYNESNNTHCVTPESVFSFADGNSDGIFSRGFEQGTFVDLAWFIGRGEAFQAGAAKNEANEGYSATDLEKLVTTGDPKNLRVGSGDNNIRVAFGDEFDEIHLAVDVSGWPQRIRMITAKDPEIVDTVQVMSPARISVAKVLKQGKEVREKERVEQCKDGEGKEGKQIIAERLKFFASGEGASNAPLPTGLLPVGHGDDKYYTIDSRKKDEKVGDCGTGAPTKDASTGDGAQAPSPGPGGGGAAYTTLCRDAGDVSANFGPLEQFIRDNYSYLDPPPPATPPTPYFGQSQRVGGVCYYGYCVLGQTADSPYFNFKINPDTGKVWASQLFGGQGQPEQPATDDTGC